MPWSKNFTAPLALKIYEKLNEIFRDVFDDEGICLHDDTTANDIEDWDSYGHIYLVVAIEKGFDMKITMGETVTLKNVGEMVDLILKRKG